jgi:hypothetical protein
MVAQTQKFIIMNNFMKWLGSDYKIKSIKDQTIANTMSISIIELEDGRKFVSADRALVSYDNGFYQPYVKKDETDLLIEKLKETYHANLIAM